jgi:hypothetical protein
MRRIRAKAEKLNKQQKQCGKKRIKSKRWEVKETRKKTYKRKDSLISHSILEIMATSRRAEEKIFPINRLPKVQNCQQPQM